MSEIKLDYRIFSSPALWYPAPDQTPAIAVVTSEEDASGQNIDAINAYYPDGRRVQGFPVLRQFELSMEGVAPANQLSSAKSIVQGPAELMAIDFQGRIVRFKSNGTPSLVSSVGNPVHSVLAWPPEVFNLADSGGQAILLLSLDMRPYGGSRNAVDIVDGSGSSLPGYPILLESSPAQHSPLLELGSGHLFVLLASGRVEAFELHGGRRLPGFPTAFLESEVPEGGYRATLNSEWNSIIISDGTDRLRKIDIKSGGSTSYVIPNAKRIVGLGSVGKNLYVMDSSTGLLMRIDEKGAVTGSLDLKLSLPTVTYHLQAIPTRDPGKNMIVIVTCPGVDSDAKVNSLFEQYATPAIREKINKFAEDRALREFGVASRTALLPQQRKIIDENIISMKSSYLENTLGSFKTADLIDSEAESDILVIMDEGRRMRPVFKHTIKGYEPLTDGGLTSVIHPTLHLSQSENELLLAVVLNGVNTIDEVGPKYKSIIQFHQIRY